MQVNRISKYNRSQIIRPPPPVCPWCPSTSCGARRGHWVRAGRRAEGRAVYLLLADIQMHVSSLQLQTHDANTLTVMLIFCESNLMILPWPNDRIKAVFTTVHLYFTTLFSCFLCTKFWRLLQVSAPVNCWRIL